MNNYSLDELIAKVTSKIDNLTQVYSNAYRNVHAEQSAISELNNSLQETIKHSYQLGYNEGVDIKNKRKKEENAIWEFHLEKKVRQKVKTDLLETLFEEFGITDRVKINRVLKRLGMKIDNKVEENLEQ